MQSMILPSGIVARYNNDLSGDVAFIKEAKTPSGEVEFFIPGSDLLRLVATHVCNKKISILRQATDDELLGVCTKPLC